MNNAYAASLDRSDSVSGLLKTELKRADSAARFWQTVRSTAFALAVAAAAAVLISTLLLPVLRIYGASMAPTLREGEIVVAVKTSAVERGDLVAFYYGNKVLVKRCIGVAGDEVGMDGGGHVSVNGEWLSEPYLEQRAFGECDIDLPCQVPDGRFFVVGDQRATSIDSRNTLIGCIASEQIIGKITFRLWPLSKLGRID